MSPFVRRILTTSIGTYINTLSWFSPPWGGRVAFRVFSKPRAGRLREVERSFLQTSPQRDQLSTIYGTIQSYTWHRENAPRILLLHGWESNAARWRPLLPLLLDQGYSVTAIDAPAHGDSEGQLFNMIKYAEAVNVACTKFQPQYIVGLSLGGATLAYYLAHYPQNNIERIVLMGAPSELDDMMRNFSHMLGLSARSYRGIEQLVRQRFQKDITYFSTEQFCDAIPFPTLVIHDHEDSVIKVEDSKKYHQRLAQSELFLTRGFGHRLQAQEVYERIMVFLGEGQSL